MLYLIIVGLVIAIIILLNKNKEVVEVNASHQQENTRLEQQVISKKKELETINSTIFSQQKLLTTIKDSIEEMQESVECQADSYYESCISELRKDYQKAYEKLDIELQRTNKRKADEEKKLNALKAKQETYIQAIQRQEAIAANTDYYKMIIDPIDLNDVLLLRELQKRFSRKEIIDKVIWDYYKPAYDILMTHVSSKPNTTKICGIYRITDTTTNRAYIGQSVDIRERMRAHIKAGLAYGKATNKLYQAMQEVGPENFVFEILEEVSRDQLNERETYWIDFYKTKEFGMNATRGGS